MTSNIGYREVLYSLRNINTRTFLLIKYFIFYTCRFFTQVATTHYYYYYYYYYYYNRLLVLFLLIYLFGSPVPVAARSKA